MRPKSCAALIGPLMFCLLTLLPAHAQTYQVLHRFNGTDGANPLAAPILDNAGNIYGTTSGGGIGTGCPEFSSFGCGTVFVLNKAGKQIALYSFSGPDGAGPDGGLLRDARGNLYGTTQYGGYTGDTCGDLEVGCGVAYRLNKAGQEVEYKFPGEQQGWNPTGPLTEDSSGNFYGTTRFGGESGFGTVFKIDPTGKETVLYGFTGYSDGCEPSAGVILDSAGNLYGVAPFGGSGFCDDGFGVVFKVDPAGNETVLHTFDGGDGAIPDSVLLFDSIGNLYGLTASGGSSQECGSSGCGTVFKMSPQEDGAWSEGVLYSFCSAADCADGEEPSAGPLVLDASGTLYGTTFFGGEYGGGVVFELSTTGQETVLHSFAGDTDGANPAGGLAMDSSGNLYGTTQVGGMTCFTRYTCGTVFKITP